MSKGNYLGIDIGSVAVSVAVTDEQHRVIETAYSFHKGRIQENLLKILTDIDIRKVRAIGFNSSGSFMLHTGRPVDPRIAYITAAKHFHPEVRSLLIIGAEKFGLVSFDGNGEYRNYKSNTSCAAGTGNFLDQQAERLNLSGIVEFNDMACKNRGDFPRIASRCAVFAKTDLIHAQQEGYSLSEICDGLSYGLARNIVDTVYLNQSCSGIVAAGGVALNKAVISHIEKLIHQDIITDEYANVYGAIGAAMQCQSNSDNAHLQIKGWDEILFSGKKGKQYYFPPLQLILSDYPDFETHTSYEFFSSRFPAKQAVEVDVYSDVKNRSVEVFLGIDIGSTSTKAILTDKHKEVMAGFYTRTSGQPVQAVQLLFEAIDAYSEKYDLPLVISGTGTTGSGRKFTGKIIGADMILDEISAHARAAFELDPETDTIIEIGGQDSKFTNMHHGMVTFSVMNNVCAAGTGSFIEEQAKRLGCPMAEYTQRVAMNASPLASDRCTVFMERDLNHYLMEGYSPGEILAAVLHATRENYLTKVAIRGHIGNKIFFQGATAKNKALVAAFEQKLKKPIMVSRYCHLTGALGVALALSDAPAVKTKFRGLELYRKEIPLRSEVCGLCTNHCKLKVAEIGDETEACGFLCGRDYTTHRYVKSESVQFQLIRKKKEVFRFRPSTGISSVTLGIPACLHLFEDILLWRTFFDYLGIRTVTSEDYSSAIKDGKNLTHAEFCSPMTAMHGHVRYLIDKSDYVFLPDYLDDWGENRSNKQFCYYTQFVTSILSTQSNLYSGDKILMPHLRLTRGELSFRFELLHMLESIGIKGIGILQVSLAWEKAIKKTGKVKEEWSSLYQPHALAKDDVHVMLLGRPYTILSQAMNHSIPDLFEKMGIETFFMDMLPDKAIEISEKNELYKIIQWKFASKILGAAAEIARTDHCYPVLITSFKCSPDAFIMEYFREIFDSAGKPYLILQLDEHDSTVGYETRIEAAIRAFRNHRNSLQATAEASLFHSPLIKSSPKMEENRSKQKSWQDYIQSLIHEASQILEDHAIDFRLFSKQIQMEKAGEPNLDGAIISNISQLRNKTLLIPCWDYNVAPLLEAILQNDGFDARVTSNSNQSIRQSMSFNTGQCLPLNIIVQNAIDYIEEQGLSPSDTVLWTLKSDLSCNLSMFPPYMKKLLRNYGKGMEQVAVYRGDLIFYDFSLNIAINAYLAYMFGGWIRKIGCSIRPYEKQKGETDKSIAEALKLLYEAFLHGKPKEPVIKKIMGSFEGIETVWKQRPKAAIFGDFYVRDNDLVNQELVKTVEDNGGEVITTPYNDYIKLVVDPTLKRYYTAGHYGRYFRFKFLKSLIPFVEEKYKGHFDKYKGSALEISSGKTDKWLERFGLTVMHRGESFENMIKIQALIKQHPDLDLFIQANPSFCCPSLVTEAMTAKIEEITGVPVVTLEYDGTTGFKNEDIIPYLKYRVKRKEVF